MLKHSSLFAVLLFMSSCTFASTADLNLTQKNQGTALSDTSSGSWYFSWGYNKDYWSNSDIHISQPGLNNKFTVYDVSAGDFPGWNTGIFNKDLMSPQYNIRIGHFINRAHTWGVELSFDHTKYNTDLNQNATLAGVVNGQLVTQNSTLTKNYFYYALHNGANELMLNLVRREPLIDLPRANMQLVAIGKVGAGVMVPHPENTIFGQQSDVGPKAWGNYFGWNHGWWQLGGWTAGVEVGGQLVFHKRVYLELTDKEAYTNLSGIQVYQGSASQAMWLNEVILSLGAII